MGKLPDGYGHDDFREGDDWQAFPKWNDWHALSKWIYSSANSGVSGKKCVCANTHGYGYIVTLVECGSEILTIPYFSCRSVMYFILLCYCSILFLAFNIQRLIYKKQENSNDNMENINMSINKKSDRTSCFWAHNVSWWWACVCAFDSNQTPFYICTFFSLTMILFVLKCEAAYLLT